MPTYTNIDEYIADFPENAQIKMHELRDIIKKTAQEIIETIGYNMPAFRQKGILVYFAAYKNHIGFYPTSSGIKQFESQFSGFKYSKGAVQFPIDQPLPEQLIVEIVKFRMMEDFLKKKN